TRRPDVSVVVPLYNEEENVIPLCEAIRDALAQWPQTWEAVFVDDGSRDGTIGLLLSQAQKDQRIRVVRLRRNAGQTAAMAEGFARAEGAVIVSMDGDLQNDPRDIPLLVSRIQ